MKTKKFIYIVNGKTIIQEAPDWSENTRKLSGECKVDCPTAAKALELLRPWKIEP
jgi:hypothetical protein